MKENNKFYFGVKCSSHLEEKIKKEIKKEKQHNTPKSHKSYLGFFLYGHKTFEKIVPKKKDKQEVILITTEPDKIQITIKLNGDINTFNSQIQQQYIQQLSNYLGININRISIKSVTTGSIISLIEIFKSNNSSDKSLINILSLLNQIVIGTELILGYNLLNIDIPPIANNLNYILNRKDTFELTLSGSDIKKRQLNFKIVSQPQKGILQGSDTTYTYIPNNSEYYSDYFTYYVYINNDISNIATVNIKINNPPITSNINVIVNKNKEKLISLIGLDSDSDSLSYIIIKSPKKGNIIQNNNIITYTPNNNYTGSDSFTYKVNDGYVDSNISTVSIRVNSSPIANDINVITNKNQNKVITLFGSDSDGNNLTYIIVSYPNNGSLNGNGNSRNYIPANNYTGSDSFTYKIYDGYTYSNIAIVSIIINTPPIVSNINFTINKNTQKSITLLGNDSDNNNLTYVIVSQPNHGSLSGIGNNITYIPINNYIGPDNFTYKANDGIIDSNIANVSITINSPPVANNINTFTNKNVLKSITLSANDLDDDNLTYIIVSHPSHGTLSGTDNNRYYMPISNYIGSDSFTYKVYDGFAYSNIAIVSIIVNSPPFANNINITTNKNTQKTITLSASDPDNDNLTYIIVSQPINGLLTGNGNNRNYIPTNDYTGSDSFTYKVNDGYANSNIATVLVTVNSPPVVNNINITTNKNNSKTLTLLASDPENNNLTYIIVSDPLHGSLSGNGKNRNYIPTNNYTGSDSFTYKVNDGFADSNIGTVSITVNSPPIANNIDITTYKNTQKTITLSASDSDNNNLIYIIVSQPNNGSLSGNGNNINYIPTNNYTGSDSFTYKVNDGYSDSNIATVSIIVNLQLNLNSPPVANNINIITNKNTPKIITLLANDLDNDSLTYIIVSQPNNGSLSGNGSNLNYIPNNNYTGSDSFTYKVNDGNIDSNIATVSIVVNSSPVANNINITTNKNTQKTITLLANDLDNDSLTYIVVTQPNNGSLSGNGSNLNYIPNNNYTGSDSFTYKVNDGNIDSNIATVSIIVNSPPVANNINIITNKNTQKTITLSGSDLENNSLTYIVVTQPNNGSLSGNGNNRNYIPNNNYIGFDSFTYKVNDNNADSNTATVSIVVNSPPIANSINITTDKNTQKTITLSGSDLENNSLTYIIVSQPDHGSLSGNGNNITYTPINNYTGSDSFTYKVNDGNADSNIAIVSIIINSNNSIPVYSLNNILNTNKNTSLNINLDTYYSKENLTYIIVSQPNNGSLSGNGNNITYTPINNYTGLDSFTYKVNDGNVDSNIATISLLIGGLDSGGLKIIIAGFDYNPITELLTIKLKNNGDTEISNITEYKLIINNIWYTDFIIEPSSSSGISKNNSGYITINYIEANEELFLKFNTKKWLGQNNNYIINLELISGISGQSGNISGSGFSFIKLIPNQQQVSGWVNMGPNRVYAGDNVENMLEDRYNGPSWTTICGAIDCVWSHPTNSNILIIGGVGGGIWKTINAKQGEYINWENKSDELALGITEICSDIFNSDRLVAVSGASSSYGDSRGADPDNGILVSTDGGNNWIKKRIIINNLVFNLDLSSVICWNNKILVGSHRFGLGGWINPGINWSRGGLFISDDFGDTWTEINSGTNPNSYEKDVTSLEICKIGSNIILYAALLTSGIFKSIDEGNTWINITSNISFMNNYIGISSNNNMLLSACKSDPNVLYTIIVNNGRSSVLAYTIDGGSNWLQMDNPKTYDVNGTAHYLHPMTNKDNTPKTSGKTGGQGAIHLSLLAHPQNSNIVFVGGDRQPELGGIMEAQSWTGRLFRGDRNKTFNSFSTLGYSQQWSHITHTNTITDRVKYGGLVDGGTYNSSAPHADSRWMVIDADNNLVEVNDGGICKLTNCLGKNGKWYSLNGDMNTFEIHSIAYDRNNDKILTGTQDNGTIVSDNIYGTGIMGGDGGDVQVAIINETVNNKISHYFCSFQRGAYFQRRIVINGIIPDWGEVISWLNGKMSFTPTIALNRKNPNKLAVQYIDKTQSPYISQIYICDLSINIENKTLVIDNIPYSYDVTGPVKKIIYGHQNDENIIYLTTNNGLIKYSNSIQTTYNMLNLTLDNKYSLKGLDINPNNKDKIIITSTWNSYEGEYFSTYTIDNNLIILDTLNNIGQKVTTPFNKTYCCIYINNSIFIGHSKGVSFLNESESKWIDVYSLKLPNITVLDMVYDNILDKLVIATMGRGAFYLNNVSQYSINTESNPPSHNTIITNFTI